MRRRKRFGLQEELLERNGIIHPPPPSRDPLEALSLPIRASDTRSAVCFSTGFAFRGVFGLIFQT